MENGEAVDTVLKHESNGYLDQNSNGSSLLESLFQRRVEFHLARKPFKGFSNGSTDFQLETLNPSSENQKQGSNMIHSNGSEQKKSEGSDFLDIGLDPELNFGFTLRKIGAGLENLGNTCFLNSVLQCLTYTEPLAAYLQSGKHQNSCRIAGFCALCAIQRHVSRALQSSGRILAPKDLVSNLRCISRSFRNARQEDAHEYMVNLLESMHKCCLPSGVPSGSPSAYEKSLVHKIFGGQLRSQVKCLQCSHCSNTFDPFLDLSLEIVKADSLYKALRNFTAAEQLDGGERQFHCQQCNQKVRALKQLTVHKAPYVLTIHLKRFRAHNPGQKIDKKVQFEPTLDLKPFVSGSYEGGLKYTLYGVLVHCGWSTHSGHYYCFVRTSSGMWYSLDDNRVVQVSEKKVLEQKAYMLFYVRDRSSSVSRKSVDSIRKENLKTSESGNRAFLNMSYALKESFQNGVKGNGLKIAHASIQKDTLDDSLKGNSVREASITKDSAFTITGGMLPNQSPLLQSSLKEPALKESLKNGSVSTSSKGNRLPSLRSDNDCISHDPEKARATAKSIDNCKNMGTQRNPNVSSESVNCSESQVSGFEKVSGDKTAQKRKRMLGTTVTSKSPCEKAGVDSQVSETDSLESTDPQDTPNGSMEIKSPDSARRKRLKKKLLSSRSVGMRLGTSILRASIGIWKKKKFKRSKRCTSNSKSLLEQSLLDGDAISTDLGPSTSEKTRSICVDTAHSKGEKVKSCSKKEAKNIVEKEVRKKASLQRDFQVNDSDSLPATDGPLQNGSSSSIKERTSNVRETNGANDCSKDGMQNGFTGILTRGLEGTVVPRWDDVDLPSPQVVEPVSTKNIKIGYVADEWDEEYDRGKRKKLRQSKHEFGGPNLFQEIANKKSQLRMEKVGHSDSGNKPFRI